VGEPLLFLGFFVAAVGATVIAIEARARFASADRRNSSLGARFSSARE
jgi:hypothetical protein